MRSRTVQPGFNFEYLMWIFTRISGIAMVTFGAIGMLGGFLLGARNQLDLPSLMRWTFFPNQSHVVSYVPDVALGWLNGFWIVMQILILAFGITHGFNGLRVVVEDFAGQSFFRPLMRGLVFTLWLFMLVVAVLLVFSSSPLG